MKKPKYKRIILKISGEALLGDKSFGIDHQVVKELAEELKEVYHLGIELGIVIGGGNIFRGIVGQEKGMDRVRADCVGMLATLINALVIQDALISQNIPCRIMSAFEVVKAGEIYIRERALKHLEKGRILLLACGTGNPFFTTDTAAVLRALELNAEILFKATKVDGVYDKDPVKDPTAKKYDILIFDEALEKKLKVMDATAFSLARDYKLPVLVFNILKSGNIKKAVLGEKIGTLIRP